MYKSNFDFESRRQDRQELYDQLILAGAKPHRNNMFCCPYHNDSTPSAGIKRGSKGWFYKCFVCNITRDVWDVECENKGLTLTELVREYTGNTKTTANWQRCFKTLDDLINAIDAIDVEEKNLYTNPETGNIDLFTIRYIPRGEYKKSFLQGHQTPAGFVPKRPNGLLPLFNRIRIKDAETVLFCYSDDTEILTFNGWKLFQNLTNDDKVGQYDQETGEISFVFPLEKQKFNYCGNMVNFKGRVADILVTPNHRMLVRNKNPYTKGLYPSKVVEASNIGANKHIPVSGLLREQSVDYSPAQARLLIAYVADGIKPKTEKCIIKWNLKKERKKSRLRDLLRELKISFNEKEYPSAIGYTDIRIQQSDVKWLMELAPNKVLPELILQFSLESRIAALNELGYWDGDTNNTECIRFFTGKQIEADIVTRLAAISGFSCSIRTDTHKPNPSWVVTLLPKQWRLLPQFQRKSLLPYNGEVYCVTVPKGFVVLRRNGKNFISGNCEGEKCVRKLTELGFTATTGSGGSSNASAHDYSPLSGKRVIIWHDNDLPGKQYAEQVRDKLLELENPPTVFSIDVNELELPDGGDIVDLCEKVIKEGGSEQDCKDYIQSLIDDSSEVNRLQCLEDLLEDMREGKYTNLPIKDFPILTNEANLLLNKRIGIIYGTEGFGKTLFIGKACDDLLLSGRKIARLQLEDEMEQHLLRSLAQQSLRGELASDRFHKENPLESKVIYEQFKPTLEVIAPSIIAGEHETWDDQKILNWIESQLSQGKELVVVDPISVIMSDRIWITSHRLMWNLKKLMAKYPEGRVVMISHPDNEGNLSGGKAFRRFSHCMLVLNRFKKPKDVEIIDINGELQNVTIDASIGIVKARYGKGSGLEIAVKLDGSTLKMTELGIITRELKQLKPVGRSFEDNNNVEL